MTHTNVAYRLTDTPPTLAATGTEEATVATRWELVLANRQRAFKVARRMLLSMGALMHSSETQSIADAALIEAASRYRQVEGAQFFTYSFYFIKAEVRKALRLEHESRKELEGNDASSGAQEGDTGLTPLDRLASEDALPDKVVELNQVRLLGFNAPGVLTETERALMRGVYVLDMPTEDIGAELGYSRGHAYAIRKAAERKLRNYLNLR